MVTPTSDLTVAYIRDSVRKNAYVGDVFEALTFMLNEYDKVYGALRRFTKPVEYNVTGADVV